MQQFQNMNSNYYNPYMQPQQQYNPYMQRMENLQQFQQAIQQPIVPSLMSGANQMQPMGKIVENVDTVKTTEIPYQGVYYFPKADGTEIYSKQWLENGQTRILTFKPVLDDNASVDEDSDKTIKFEEFSNVLMGIQNDIKTLADKIDKIGKPIKKKEDNINE